MNIEAMLNPPDATVLIQKLPTRSSPHRQRDSGSPPRSAPRLDKASKDGFVNTKAEARAEMRFPPYEVRCDKDIAPQLDKYSVAPDQTMGRFFEYPRYIPYKSTKRDLQNKTGLKGFNGEISWTTLEGI